MKTILVLFGGCSTEYEVSLHSAYAVLSHMDPARYTPLAVGITREGQWLCYRVARELSRRKNCSKIRSNFSWGMFFPALEKVSTIFPASIRPAISTVLSGRL